MSAPSERQAAIETATALLGLAVAAIVLWERFNPEGPRGAWASLRAQWGEWRDYHAAMRRTLDEIDELPELEDG